MWSSRKFHAGPLFSDMKITFIFTMVPFLCKNSFYVNFLCFYLTIMYINMTLDKPIIMIYHDVELIW